MPHTTIRLHCHTAILPYYFTNIRLYVAPQFLHADGGTVNERVREEGTAAHVACEKGHADVLDVLLRFGADIEAQACAL